MAGDGLYNIQVHIRKKGQKSVQNMLSCIKVKFLSKIYIELQVIQVILQVLHELQVIQKQYFCRKIYTQNNVLPFFFHFRENCIKT
jgi:hypothetical protein